MARSTRYCNKTGALWVKDLCNKIDDELKELTCNGERLTDIVMMTNSCFSSHGGCLSTSAITKIFNVLGDEVIRDATAIIDFGSGLGQVTTYAWGIFKHLDVYAIERDEKRINFQRDRLSNYPYDKSRFKIVATDWTRTYLDNKMWGFLNPVSGYGIVFINNLNMYGHDILGRLQHILEVYAKEGNILGRLQHILEVYAKEGTYVVTLSPMFGRSRWILPSQTHHRDSNYKKRGIGIPIDVGSDDVSWVGGETTLTAFVYQIKCE